MTTVVAAQSFTVTSETVSAARAVQQPGLTLTLHSARGQSINLPPNVQQVLLQTLEAMARIDGRGTVTIGTMPDELTSSTAASLLGVSRPTLLKWSRGGKINSFKVGTHTRFHRDDVIALRNEREKQRRDAFNELRALDAEDEFEVFGD